MVKLVALVLFAALLGLGLLDSPPSAAAPSASTPISACGTTINSAGNYKLAGNLAASGATCITITANNVSIDLGGHTISGNASSSTSMFGITDGGNTLSEIAILNGTVTGFNVDLALKATNSATIDHVKLSGAVTSLSSGDGDGLEVACCSTLANVIAINNQRRGIDANGCCFTIVNTTATNNGDVGIVAGGCCSTVTNSKATGNGGDGIDATGCCNSIVSCSATGNVGDGVYASSSNQSNQDNLVTNGKFTKNGNNGVELDENGLITATSATGNHTDGVSLICPGNAVLVKALHNSGANLAEDTSAGPCTNVNNRAP